MSFSLTSLPPALYDALNAQFYQGLPMPVGVNQQIVEQISGIVYELTQVILAPAEVQKLGIGPFIKDLLTTFQDHINHVPTPSWTLYSGHDITVASVLASFGVYNAIGDWPQFASHVELELYSDNTTNYYIRVVYNNAAYPLPGCKNNSSTFPPEYCPFTSFSQLAQQVIPEERLGQGMRFPICPPISFQQGQHQQHQQFVEPVLQVPHVRASIVL